MRFLILLALLGAPVASAQAAGDASAQAVVPVRPIQRGERIERSDLRVVAVRNARPVAYRVARRIADAVGREATRTLLPRRYVPLSALRAPLAVRRGERVRVRLTAGALSILASARALGDAAAGQSVRVRIERADAVDARVVGPALVEIVR